MIYLIGNAEALKHLFPEHNWLRARYSLNGKHAITEIGSLTAEQRKELSRAAVNVFTHEEALAYLNATDKIGIWYEQTEIAAPAVNRKQKVPNRRQDL